MSAVALRRAETRHSLSRIGIAKQIFPGLTVVALWSVLSAQAGLQTGGQTTQASGASVAPATALVAASGSISGTIWWDSGRIKTSPAALDLKTGKLCNGFSVQAIMQTGPAPAPQPGKVFLPDPPTIAIGSLQGFKPSVNAHLASCSFTITNLPEGVDLMVHATVKQADAPFMEPVTAAANQAGFFKIPGGACKTQAANGDVSTTSLEAPVHTCGNTASNVNFEIQMQLQPLN